MKLNSDRAVELGRALFDRYGDWQAVRDAGVEMPDGVIDMTEINGAIVREAEFLLDRLAEVNEPDDLNHLWPSVDRLRSLLDGKPWPVCLGSRRVSAGRIDHLFPSYTAAPPAESGGSQPAAVKSEGLCKSEGVCRVDLDDDGIHVDDVAISGDLIKMFRLEDMGHGQFWGAVYLRDGRDLRFSFDGSKAQSLKVIAEWEGRALNPDQVKT